MIKFVQIRYKPNEKFPPEEREWTAAGALSRLLTDLTAFTVFEEVTPRRVACRVNILNCTDVETFEGSTEEMRTVFLTAAFYMACVTLNHKPSFEYVLSQLRGYGYNKERLLAACDQAFSSKSLARASVLLAVGVEPTSRLVSIEEDNLITMVALHLETGVPFEEIVAQLAA